MSVLRKKRTYTEIVLYKLNFYFRFISSPLRALPDFLIIGAAKAGTTSLYNYLLQHPHILPCFKKEVHFFDSNFNRKINWYKSFFPLRNKKRNVNKEYLMCGESSPYYLYHPLSAERIAETIPSVKFFILLRNPIDRAVSHYNHRVRAGTETLPIEAAFAKETERLAGEEEKLMSGNINLSFNHFHYSYLSRGIYEPQLKRWFQYFSADQFLILESNELFLNPQIAFAKVLKHLNLEAKGEVIFKKYNSGEKSEYKNINPELRSKLLDFYKPENEKLFKLLNRQFDWNK